MKLSDVGLVDKNIRYHGHLSPAAWDDWEMLPDVREKLIDIAQLFIDYLEIPNFKAIDIRLTGSLANFNWTKFSDFDLHVVTDYTTLECDDVAESLYKAKKTIWNDKHDIYINGHEVELYIEDINKPPHSAGVFSVLKNKWIARPEYVPPSFDRDAVNRKAKSYIDLIQKTIRRHGKVDELKMIIDRVYKMRQSGLEAGGEFSTENLAFKILRNLGWIERLRDAYNTAVDKKLSL